MGQKINSIGFRLGIRSAWNSVWNTEKKDYFQILFNDLESKYLIKNILKSLGLFSNYLIFKKSSKKSYIFSKFISSDLLTNWKDQSFKNKSIKNKNMKYLSPFLGNFLFSFLKLNFSSLKLKKSNKFNKSNFLPFICAQTLSDFIVLQESLPNKYKNKNFKWGLKMGIIKLAHFFFNSKTVNLVSGIKLICSGRWTKTKSSRKQKFIYSLGKLKNQTISAFLDYGFSFVITKYGTCSLKVWISYKYIK